MFNISLFCRIWIGPFDSAENGKSKLHCNRKFTCVRGTWWDTAKFLKWRGECSLLVLWWANLRENGRSIVVRRKGSREVDTALFFPRGSCSRRRFPQYDKTAACTSHVDGRLHGASISTILRFKPWLLLLVEEGGDLIDGWTENNFRLQWLELNLVVDESLHTLN